LAYKLRKLLLLLFLLVGFNAFAEIDFSLSDFCYEQPNVQERNGIYYFPNQDTGITYISSCVYKNSNGKLQSKGRLLNGLKDGVWIYWTSYGSKESQEYWSKGVLEKYIGHYGNLRFEVTYKNGLESIRQHYDSDNLILDAIYNTPEHKVYEKHYMFHDNGNLQWSYTKVDFGDGLVRHGKSELWYANAQKKEEIDYINGVMGNWKEWYDNGQMSIDILQNDKGEFHGTSRWWYPDGTLSQVSHYSNGEVVTEKGFDKTGKCIQGDCDE
jgi:antitoxin component YwqK of YwqJK toxin-antitoxin module